MVKTKKYNKVYFEIDLGSNVTNISAYTFIQIVIKIKVEAYKGTYIKETQKT